MIAVRAATPKHDQPNAAELQPGQPLAEEHVGRHARDGSELRRQDGGDSDAVARADDVGREAEHLGEPGCHHEWHGRTGEPEPAGQRQGNRHRDHADHPRGQQCPAEGQRGAQPSRREQTGTERERRQRREPDRGRLALARQRQLLWGDAGQDDPGCHDGEQQGECDAERLAGCHGQHRRDGTLGREDRCDEPDLAAPQRRVRQKQAQDVTDASRDHQGEVRTAERPGPRADGDHGEVRHQPGEHHPGQHRGGSDHAAGAGRAQRARRPHQRSAEPSEDGDHGSVADPHGIDGRLLATIYGEGHISADSRFHERVKRAS